VAHNDLITAEHHSINRGRPLRQSRFGVTEPKFLDIAGKLLPNGPYLRAEAIRAAFRCMVAMGAAMWDQSSGWRIIAPE
jgi:hypothetical protein